jgi:eukaryotic-like serine/threonine-protein kinase
VGGVVSARPLASGGVIYVTSADGRLYALDARRGTALWSVKLGGQLGSSPVISGGLIYVGSAVSDNSGSLCIVGTDGKIVKEYQTGGQVQSSPLAAGGWVVVGSENDAVLGVRLAG